jgi:hypothetical protein
MQTPGDKRIKVIVPIPMDEAGVANRASQLPAGFVAPGYKPEFQAVPWGAALGDSYHDMLLMDWTVFQAGIDAEEQGYSGVLIDNRFGFRDAGAPLPIDDSGRGAGRGSILHRNDAG